MNDKIVIPDQWQKLKQFTKARVSLGNVGTGLPLSEVLALKHAHALAKDAIVTELDVEDLKRTCAKLNVPCQVFKSKAQDRLEYLKRPDLGRRLELNSNHTDIEKVDIIFVITDGLSATAVNKYACELLGIILPEITKKYKVAIALVEQGRVAVGDEVAELYRADFVTVLIGERPGLSSPESMGVYTTYKPKLGLTDERRNCISNIHADGLSAIQGSTLLKYLINRSFALKLSGVDLKIEIGDILENKKSQ
ncbi:ethanolamine ammonia-lyase subunit EutC [Maribacter sp. X9]|uniref:ethanolamine ammonia-lyase subunit EutC n=1 Tax=Maribacter sp. X9 TaxID=3402159 RepID=UPI003AF40221